MIGGVVPGTERKCVRDLFGDPHEYSAGFIADRAPIWRYGGVEIHFDQATGVVTRIYTDEPEALAALGVGISHGMTLMGVEAELSLRAYSFARIASEVVNGATCVRLGNGIQLLFDTECGDDKSKQRLHAVVYEEVKSA